MKIKSSETIISLLKGVFSHFGIPEEIVADNNLCGSREFLKFTEEWHFKITLSNPNYPKSNGLAEKTVGIAKRQRQDKLSKLWSRAEIVIKTKWPRSYLVKDNKGRIFRRNTIFIKKLSKFDLNLEDSEEVIE